MFIPLGESIYNRSHYFFNLKICIINNIVGFIITQLILDGATLFNIAVITVIGKGCNAVELIETRKKYHYLVDLEVRI